MKKAEVIVKIRETAARIMEAVNFTTKSEEANKFTAYLISVRNNEMCKYTLNFVLWCNSCKDWKLEERTKTMLEQDLHSLTSTLEDLTNYESSKTPVTVEMMLVDGDDLVSGEILEEIGRQNSNDISVGYSIIKVTAPKLSEIVRVTPGDLVYRASAVENNTIKEWTQIGGDK